MSAAAAREIRAALTKSKLTDASAAVVIQMKPIPKVCIECKILWIVLWQFICLFGVRTLFLLSCKCNFII